MLDTVPRCSTPSLLPPRLALPGLPARPPQGCSSSTATAAQHAPTFETTATPPAQSAKLAPFAPARRAAVVPPARRAARDVGGGDQPH